ncbi:peptidoglycan-associated lipoprotein Pal [Desulfosoma caldarium]|uniref:Peptidoglycan-associated protein n=1 Tax=Desulfosoma caldarium TaxID=610254 RepID=A0A3N1VF38_9BACT|nr:peptidoglycan-associated lipoprotein Pal [Desulfosoma caldarium]ROR01486.1 peptidoglycan-associated lipoprotein [Desulfosoma caldarium]
MNHRLTLVVGIWCALVLAILNLTACSKKAVPGQAVYPSAATALSAPETPRYTPGGPIDEATWQKLGLRTEEERQRFLKEMDQFQNEDIHFEFDAYVLMEEAKAILDKKVDFLRRYPTVYVIIEGHCDERGTNDYNLALGERRANSAWQYLVNSGIDPSRLSMISYGEERPIALGHDEASWAKNRRAHFVVQF